MTEAKQANAVTEQQVFDFLATHPDFLERHPKLLSHITISHQVEGGVSLVDRQVNELRDKNRELQGKLIEMLRSAQDNEQLLEKCIRLVLCLIDCQSLQQLTNTLNDLLKREFDLDLVSGIIVQITGPRFSEFENSNRMSSKRATVTPIK